MTSIRDIAGAVTLCVTIAVGAATYAQLPDPLVTQWGLDGTPTTTMAKPLALAFVPALIALIWALFVVDYEIDPLGTNIATFAGAHDALGAATMGFLAYVHLAIVAWNLGFTFGIERAIVPPMAALLYVIGVVLPRAERNWFVGIRTPWTLSNETVWRRTHDRFGPLYKLAGVITLLGVLAPQQLLPVVLVGPVLLVSLASIVYSFHCYREVGEEASVEPEL